MLALGSVDGRYCRINNMIIEHFRGGNLEFDPWCTTCTFMTTRGRQHRRHAEEETAGAGGEVCADLTGKKINKSLQWVRVSAGCAAKRNALWFRQSVVEQTKRDHQTSDGGHAFAVESGLAFPQ